MGAKFKCFAIMGLMLIAGLVFVSCDDSNYSAESIKFKEESQIVIVVGDEYTPSVSVLPSYASNKGYRLEVMGNDLVLRVDGKKIVGLKEGVVQLKCVADDNEYLNDVVSVKVLQAPVQLKTPTDLRFDGENIIFSPSEWASSYSLSINDEVLLLQGRTTIALTECSQLLDKKLTDKVLNIKVKAIGDSRISVPSDYSQDVAILKISSPNDLIVKDNILSFTKVSGVKKYLLKISQDGDFNMEIDSAQFVENEIKVDLKKYLGELISGEYQCALSCEKTGYDTIGEVEVFASEVVQYVFDVVGKPTNITVNNQSLVWDSVYNADYYTVIKDGEVIADNIESNHYYIGDALRNGQSYSYQVVACSRKNQGVVSGVHISQSVNFVVLENPTVALDVSGKKIDWSGASDAIAYKVVVKKSGVVISENVIVGHELDVQGYENGDYTVEITSLGTGIESLSAIGCASVGFEVQATPSNLKMENKVIKWDEVEGAKYNLVIEDSNGVELKNEIIQVNSFDLSSYVFDSGEYIYKLSCLEQEGKLASQVARNTFYKLEEVEDVSVSDGVVSFKIGLKTSETLATITKKGTSNAVVLSKKSNKISEYLIDVDDLAVGEYAVQVYALGNGQNILDADNNNVSITVEKLGNPQLMIDKVNEEIGLETSVLNAQKYELYQNGIKAGEFDSTNIRYGLSNLTSGEYFYQVKSIGNGECVLDSNLSSVDLKVLKLSTPSIDFDKSTRKFEVTSQESDYVLKYNFFLDGVAEECVAGEVDCSQSKYFQTAKKYYAQVNLLAGENDEYDYILNSDSVSLEVEKINAIATLTLENGKIKIVPTNFVADDSYLINLQIGYLIKGSYNYVNCNILYMLDGAYCLDVMDSMYNIIGQLVGGEHLFELARSFKLKWTVGNNNKYLLDSNEVILGDVSRRNAVSNILRSGSDITFNSVGSLAGYKLKIVSSDTYFVDLKTSTISIGDLVEKFGEQGLSIAPGRVYDLQIVAIGDDTNRVLPSISEEVFSFKILNTPTASIKLDSSREKVVEILENVDGAEKFVLTFIDKNNTSVIEQVACDTDEALNYALSNLSGLVAGNVSVSLKAVNTSLNYFDSDESYLQYTILDTPQISISNGMVSWSVDEHALEYSLYYFDDEWHVKNLSLEDVVKDDKAVYDLGEILDGYAKVKIKSISILNAGEDYFYDSSDSEELTIMKISQPDLTIANGEIVIGLVEEQLQYIDNIKIKNLQTDELIDLFALTDKLQKAITIQPQDLLQYLSDNEIAGEEIEIVAYAKNGDELCYILNSMPIKYTLYGLKMVEDVQVITSEDYIDVDDGKESVDKIVWENNVLNQDKIRGYLLQIEYTGENNDKSLQKEYVIEGEQVNLFTFPQLEEFGTGTYKVKIKVLAKENSGYLNSNYCEDYVFTLMGNPKNVRTNNGKVTWDSLPNANAYLVRVFDKAGNYLTYKKVSNNVFDFNSLTTTYQADIYGLTVQAINEMDSNVISSGQSNQLYIAKLPSIVKYKLEMGNIYVYVHDFVGSVELVLTSGTKEYTFKGCVEQNLENLDGEDWLELANVDTILSDETMFSYKVFDISLSGDNYTQIIDCLNDGYTLSMQAIGNSGKTFAFVNSDVTQSTSSGELINDNVANEVSLIKTKMPQLDIKSRAVVSWEMKDVEYSDMDYNGCKNILIYIVNISVRGSEHSFLVADNIDINNLPSGLTYVAFKSVDKHTYDGYLIFDNGTESVDDDMYINVLRYTDGEEIGSLSINFNLDEIYYAKRYSTGSNVEMGKIDVAKGGNFDVTVNVLGDSSIYLTSNKSKSKMIVRYQQLTLELDDGYVVWKNLRTAQDSPIYLVKITSKTNDVLSYVYLYDEVAGDDFTLPEVIEGKTYRQAISYNDDMIRFMLDTQYLGEYLYDDDSYNVNVTSYYRDITSYSTLQAKSSPTFSLTKLKQLEVDISGGNLKWKQTSVANSTSLIYDYEITVVQEDYDIVFRIEKQDYSIVDGYISYNLPKTITTVDGESFDFIEGKTYNFTIKALGGTSSYVNSNESSVLSTGIMNGISNLRVENGIIRWDGQASSGYRLCISYMVDDVSVKIIKETLDANYKIPYSIEDITGQTRYITSDYLYYVSVMKIGGSSMLSSFYSEPMPVEKLKTSNIGETSSVEGVVEWEKVADLNGIQLQSAEYELVFVDGVYKNGELITSDVVSANSCDFAGYQIGEIKFAIITRCAGYLDSEMTQYFTYYKFGKISGFESKKDADGVLNTLTWSAVSVNGVYADAYQIAIYNMDSDLPVKECCYQVEEDANGTLEYNLADLQIDLANMRVRIKAITKLEASNLINGEWSEFYSLQKAEEIDAETFVLNGLLVEWRANESEQPNDTYVLQYYYQSKSSQVSVNETISFDINSDSYAVDENGGSYKVYYYKLYKVGIYSNFRMIVNRAGSMSSNPVQMTNDDGYGNVVATRFEMNLFADGDGTSENPYKISNLAHLNNVNYYPTSNYILTTDIALGEIEGTIIDEFKGVFDGQNHVLSNITITTSGNYLGIFKSLNGANVENLNINYVEATLDSAYDGSEMFGGILAGMVDGTTITNVSIKYSTFNIKVTDETSGNGNNSNFYFGGMVGRVNNSTLSNCDITLRGEDVLTESRIEVYGYARDNVYFGGMAGYIVDTDICGSKGDNASISIIYSAIVQSGSGRQTLPNVTIGGAVGFVNNSDSTKGIRYATVEVVQNKVVKNGAEYNAEILNNGGVCGEIKNGRIDNVIVSGEIGANEKTYYFNSINIGKLVAICGQDVILLDNNVENMTLSYLQSDTNVKVYKD